MRDKKKNVCVQCETGKTKWEPSIYKVILSVPVLRGADDGNVRLLASLKIKRGHH